MTEPSDLPEAFSFGQTVVVPQRRELTHAGRRIEIGGRAFDLLIALIEAHGMPVSRDSLRSKVWPDRVIEDNTVEARISVIRRALGNDRDAISTIEGLGYQFVAELTSLTDSIPPLEQPSAPHSTSTGPSPIRNPSSALIGRERELATLTEVVRSRRLITLVGAGGVGKTKLAFEVARALAPEFPDGIFHTELGTTPSQEYVVSAMASALGVAPDSAAETLDNIVDVLGYKHLLLVVDNCEHLIDSVAHTIEHLLSVAPRLTVIATSREALRINGEYLFRVVPLGVPPDDGPADARAFGALQLFEHLVAVRIRDAELPIAVEICRRLDGIPLAIELAAACVPALGFAGIVDQLNDRFWLLTRGARTALPRQQTLLATLDWSYELLDAKQQTVLERVSLFAGHFTLDAAQCIATDSTLSPHDVLHAMIDLEQKSLLGVSTNANGRLFKLLESTRVYAQIKLRERKDFSACARSHAKYILDLFVEVERGTHNWVPIHSLNGDVALLDDLRMAVTWGFEPGGEADIAVDLVIASAPISIRVSLFDECLARIDKALKVIATQGGGQAERAMKLYAARGTCLVCQGAGPETGEAFDVARQLAEELDSVDYKMQAIWGQWCFAYQTGKYSEVAILAQDFAAVVAGSSSTADSVVAYRLSGTSHLLRANLGAASSALHAAEEQLCDVPCHQRVRFLHDEAVLVHSTLALVAWYRGRPQLAALQAQRALEYAEELNHPPSVCYALSAGVCTIALLTGDIANLERAVEKLQEATGLQCDSTWIALAKMWKALLTLRQGQADEFERVIVPGLGALGAKRYMVSITPFIAEAALMASRQGRASAPREQIGAALSRALAIGDECSIPELERVKAELLLGSGGDASGCEEAGRLLLDACERSVQLGNLAWNLRSATSLARHWRNTEGHAKAKSILTLAYEAFEEGYDTVDLRSAREVLQALA